MYSFFSLFFLMGIHQLTFLYPVMCLFLFDFWLDLEFDSWDFLCFFLCSLAVQNRAFCAAPHREAELKRLRENGRRFCRRWCRQESRALWRKDHRLLHLGMCRWIPWWIPFWIRPWCLWWVLSTIVFKTSDLDFVFISDMKCRRSKHSAA